MAYLLHSQYLLHTVLLALAVIGSGVYTVLRLVSPGSRAAARHRRRLIVGCWLAAAWCAAFAALEVGTWTGALAFASGFVGCGVWLRCTTTTHRAAGTQTMRAPRGAITGSR